MPEIVDRFLTKNETKMANRDQFKLSLQGRRRRTFSEAFKCDKVHEIELGKV